MSTESLEHLADTLEWDVHEILDKLDRSVEVRVTDDEGNVYSAYATLESGKITNIHEIEKL